MTYLKKHDRENKETGNFDFIKLVQIFEVAKQG